MLRITFLQASGQKALMPEATAWFISLLWWCVRWIVVPGYAWIVHQSSPSHRPCRLPFRIVGHMQEKCSEQRRGGGGAVLVCLCLIWFLLFRSLIWKFSAVRMVYFYYVNLGCISWNCVGLMKISVNLESLHIPVSVLTETIKYIILQ